MSERQDFCVVLRLGKITMASSVDVVDYVAAMEQCGDDREFLCELLHDLKAELDTQLCNIQENLEHVSYLLAFLTAFQLTDQ